MFNIERYQIRTRGFPELIFPQLIILLTGLLSGRVRFSNDSYDGRA